MFLRVDPNSSAGLADQIAGQVRHAIASGELAAGDKLPPARELASGLDVNMHTVLRAYGELRDEGLIDLRRGRGAHVRVDADTGPGPNLNARLHAQIRELVASAIHLGLTRDQLIDEIRKVQP